ncbi:hypothetical protein BU25DRAFT_226606 [Macroventuria anomochaeta]|uniref:Uncharacterized protein n=1 Tax=Macroventuria anomochaeta TaxID=301207 RepID=A0ACB6SAT3_9PLEO|nr:uncharacterized protein BU25DRAFT_226606 [Macroventuria anomochaeta]KAF2631241.1 hypothetical protein BU25DRAFT_226606 [Macroventuria anomochaeta]
MSNSKACNASQNIVDASTADLDARSESLFAALVPHEEDDHSSRIYRRFKASNIPRNIRAAAKPAKSLAAAWHIRMMPKMMTVTDMNLATRERCSSRIDAVSQQESCCHLYQLLPIDENVRRVLESTLLFDTHNGLPQQPCAYSTAKCTIVPNWTCALVSKVV